MPTRRCDRLAEASALFHTAGTAHLRGRGAIAFHLDVADLAVARRSLATLHALRIDCEIRSYPRRSFDRATRYELHLEGTPTTLGVLTEAGVTSVSGHPLTRPPGSVVARPCCRAAYLRGAFLGGGSLSGPRDLQLEIRSPSHGGAAFLRSVASAVGARLRVVERGRYTVAYTKGREGVAAVLDAAGAAGTVVAIEEHALVAGLRSDANRLANADHANLVRSARSAERHLAAIARLRAANGLAVLPDPLRAVADLRTRHPSLSLAELAMRADPPLPKATLARRLAALVESAGGDL